MRVLIIEQEKIIQQSLYYFMERFKSYQVFLARSQKEGTTIFKAIPFDIVLCGDRLPDGNGLDTLKKLMSRDPKIISVLMTVRGDESLKQEAMEAGIRGYLIKPFDLKQLEEAISMGHG